MRNGVEQLVIAFATTTDAMCFETNCKNNDIPGRIIPLPISISAGCGLAYRIDPDWKERIIKFAAEKALKWETMQTVMLRR